MSRLLSVSFDYRNASYTALVTVDEMGRELDFNIRIPDERLHGIFPDDKVSYSSRTGFYSYHHPEPEAQELLGCLVKALEDRLFVG